MNTKPPSLEDRTATSLIALSELDNIVAQQAHQVIKDLIDAGANLKRDLDQALIEKAEQKQRLIGAQNTAYNLQKQLNALWDKPAQLRHTTIAVLERVDEVLSVSNLREHEDIEKLLKALADAK